MKKINMLLFSLLCILFLSSCTSFEYSLYQTDIYAMDTVINVKLYETNKSTADKHLDEIKQIYKTYSDVSDNFKPSSTKDRNLYDLNVSKSMDVSNELLDLIKYSLELKELTNGYFEPFIGGLSIKWKECLFPKNGSPKVLSDDVVKEELDKISNTSILINNSHVTIEGDALLDFGGIAKGYATEKVHKYLVSEGVTKYLISAGSSNILFGEKPNGSSYNVGLKHPFINGNYYKVLEKKNGAVVTSSVGEQNVVIDDVIYSHLLNPKTGYPVNVYDSISLIGTDSALLDGLSTALFAMSLDELKSFCMEHSISCYAFKDNKIIYEYEVVSYEKN